MTADDDLDDLVFLYDPDADDAHAPMTQHEARVEVDPIVEDFARSPYDPLYSARMLGSSVGNLADSPPRSGGLAATAFAFGMILLLTMVVAVFSGMERLLGATSLGTGFIDLLSVVTAIPFGVAGLLVVWRLVARRFR